MFLDLQRKMTLLFHLILKTIKNNPLWQSQHLKYPSPKIYIFLSETIPY